MNPIISILCFVGGLFAGSLAVWRWMKLQNSGNEAVIRSGLSAQIANLQTLLDERTVRLHEVTTSAEKYQEAWREVQAQLQAEAARCASAEQSVQHLEKNIEEHVRGIQEVSNALDGERRRVAELNLEIQELSAARAKAEEASSEIPKLQCRLDTALNELKNNDDEISRLRVQNAELQTTISKDRRAADEKLALLNEAQAALTHAFKALSGECFMNGLAKGIVHGHRVSFDSRNLRELLNR